MTTFFLNLVFFCEKLGYPNLRTFMGCVMFLLYIPLRICFSPLVVYSLYAFWADFRRLPALYLSRAARVGSGDARRRGARAFGCGSPTVVWDVGVRARADGAGASRAAAAGRG